MLRKLLLATLSWLFITILSVALMGSATEQLLQPEPYEDAFAANDVYHAMGEQFGVAVLGERVARNATITVIRGTLAYVSGEAEELHLVIHPRKALGELPTCSPGTIPSPEHLCVPPGVTPEQLESFLGDRIPEEVDLAANLNVTGIEEARGYVATGRAALVVLYALAVVLALLILFVARHHLIGGVRMLEADLLVVGGSLVVASLVLQRQVAGLLPENVAALSGVVEHILSLVLETLLVYGAVVAGVGLVALFASSVVSIEHKEG